MPDFRMPSRPLLLTLRVFAVLSAAGFLSWYVSYRAMSAPKEKQRTRHSRSKAQNIASVYAAARAAGASFTSLPAEPEGQPHPGFEITLEESDKEPVMEGSRWVPQLNEPKPEHQYAMPGSKSRMVLGPQDVSGILFRAESESKRIEARAALEAQRTRPGPGVRIDGSPFKLSFDDEPPPAAASKRKHPAVLQTTDKQP